MSDFNINNIRKSVVTSIVKEKYEGVLNEADISVELNMALANVNGGSAITKLRFQNGVTSAEDVSNTMSEIFIDLSTAYEAINLIDIKVTNTLENSLSNINKINDDIDKANTIVDEYESFMRARGNPAYRIEKFKNKSSFETDMNLYRERYNERLGSFTAGVYDENCSSLILPKLRSSNMAYYSEGVKAASVRIKRQFGSANAELRTGSNDINNVIVPNIKDVWNESILVDEPIRIIESNGHYSVNNGALCEIEIDFESVTVINEILITPFGKYPVDILSIRYSVTGAADEEEKYIVSSKNNDSSLKPKSLIEPVVYRFANTMVKKIFITINQLHYVRNAFIYNTMDNLLNNVVFSLSSNSENTDYSSEFTIFNPIYQDRQRSDAAWMLVNEIITRNDGIDIENILFSSEGKSKKAIKYHYSYGITSIEPKNNEFDRCGIYVSNPISDVGNIRSVKIITDEIHPLNRNGDTVTDVEYYISYSPNPKWYDWKPILPSNKNNVQIELLQMYDDLCRLRFEATNIGNVCIDGVEMIEGLDYFLKKNNGKIYAIEIPDYDFMSTYTVKYIPDKSYAVLDLSDTDKATSTEEFNGSNNSFFTLENSVYLSSKNDDTYVRIIDINTGAVIASGDSVKCVTDIYSSYDSYKNFNNNTNQYEYYTHKNHVYFNKPIGKDLKIEMTYKHYVNQIRLKAILRRNTKYDKHITPTVNSIKYEIVTAE